MKTDYDFSEKDGHIFVKSSALCQTLFERKTSNCIVFDVVVSVWGSGVGGKDVHRQDFIIKNIKLH